MKQGAYRINPWIVTHTLGKRPLRLQQIVDTIGWDAAKRQSPDVRDFLQKYGTEGGRYIHGEKCWLKLAERKVGSLMRKQDDVVVTDCRFVNEYHMIWKHGGIVVRINRPGIQPLAHVSELEMLPAPDFWIHNTGTVEQLHYEILKIAEQHSTA